MKTRKLSDEDRHAVDLLLDSSSGHGAVTRVNRIVSPDRLGAAKRLLATLEVMPEIDVPADLLARTLRRIEAADHPTTRLPAAVRVTPHLPPA